MTKNEGTSTRRIPEFASIEDEAAFWDSHDFTDYLDELKPVQVRFARHLSETLQIRLDQDTLRTLREQARKQGVGPATLARMWILQHVRSPRQQ